MADVSHLKRERPRAGTTSALALPGFRQVLGALMGGVAAAFVFSKIAGYPWWANETTRFPDHYSAHRLCAAGHRCAGTSTFWGKWPAAWGVSVGAAALYGFFLKLTGRIMPELYTDYPGPLYLWHMLGVIVMLTPWLLMFFHRVFKAHISNWALKLYVLDMECRPTDLLSHHRSPQSIFASKLP